MDLKLDKKFACDIVIFAILSNLFQTLHCCIPSDKRRIYRPAPAQSLQVLLIKHLAVALSQFLGIVPCRLCELT